MAEGRIEGGKCQRDGKWRAACRNVKKKNKDGFWGELKGESGRRLPAPKLIRERGRGRERQSWVLRQRPWAGLAGEIGIKTAKKPASSAFSIGPVFHPASRSRARHGENQSTKPLPPPPPRCLPRTLNLPTIASSARNRSSSPRRSPNRDNFSTAAEAFGPTHPPPPSSFLVP